MKIQVSWIMTNFEWRHAWQVSSILQQKDAPEIVMDCCLYLDDFHTGNLLPLSRGPVYWAADKQTFAKRGLVRNIQLIRARDSGCTHIMFCDADNVYHPDFFRALGAFLDSPEGRAEPHCISSRNKKSTHLQDVEALVHAYKDRTNIKDAYATADKLKKRRKHVRRVAGGNMQVQSLARIHEACGGWQYVPYDQNPDRHMFRSRLIARSDKFFRDTLGPHSCCLDDLPRFIHLEHQRDKEVGRHITDQR